MTLAPRLTIYPELAADPERWLDPDLRFPVLDRSDAEALGRDDRWAAGDHDPPPILIDLARFPPQRPGAGGEVLAGVVAGQQPGEDELAALFAARGPEVRAVAEVADELRRQAVGDVVTFVRNRNINYTNVCTFRCRFCAFPRARPASTCAARPTCWGWTRWPGGWSRPTSAGPPRSPSRAASTPASTATTTCTWPRPFTRPCPACTSTASPPEVHEGARRLGEPLRDYLLRLKAAGLASLPGTAAEILDDEVRAVICPDKVTTDEWLEVHRVAHSVGLRSNITIMFGHVESPRHWARHP